MTAPNVPAPIAYEGESLSNRFREDLAAQEPRSQRTFTPTQAVLAKSAGLYHWTPEGRRLADFTSGVLVANLGHNPRVWVDHLLNYMGWQERGAAQSDYLLAPPLTAYNALTPLEVEANRRLLQSLRQSPGGDRMEKVLWSASGSEGIQKAIWSCLAYRPDRDVILATRNGFHGKKGLAGAVTGNEQSPDRDARVRFVSFPCRECYDLAAENPPFEPKRYLDELERLAQEFPGRINCLVTEPYLGGGGSYHPPREYMQLLVDFCRRYDIAFILDEVQSNFGRTGTLYAFEKYGIEPDLVVLGKGLGNGIPVNAVAGRADLLDRADYGHSSDTWSGNPLACASVLATLDCFETADILGHVRAVSEKVEEGLRRLRPLPIVAAIRGEGMVWGVEFREAGGCSSQKVANECVRAAYLGDEAGNAIHLLGPLAGNVIRVSPPLTMTLEEAEFWFDVLHRIVRGLSDKLAHKSAAAAS